MDAQNKEAGSVQLTEAPDVFDESISHVPDKYKGTDADRYDMSVLGKKQVLRVRDYSLAVVCNLLTSLAKFQLHHYVGFGINICG